MNKTTQEKQIVMEQRLTECGVIHSELFILKEIRNDDFRKSFKNVNAGGLDVKGGYSMPYDLSFTEGVTLLGGGSNIPKLGEARYSDINPGIDDFMNSLKSKTKI